MENVKVLGYARKSPDDKKDSASSISNQVSLIESTCKEKGWDLLDIYIDKNISGGDRSRPQFNKMIKRIIEDPEITIIITKEQDRFARDSAFFSDVLRDLEIRNKKVFSIIKNNYLSYEDLGDVVTSVVDAHYIITQRKKSDVLFKQKQESGLPPIKAPFGYINKNKKWILDPKKSRIVVQVCEDYANKINFKKTLERLKIGKSLYYRILKNVQKKVYSGEIVYTRKVRDSQKKIVHQEEVRYQGSHTPIITEDLFSKVNKQLEADN